MYFWSNLYTWQNENGTFFLLRNRRFIVFFFMVFSYGIVKYAFTVAHHLRLIPIFAKVLGNKILIKVKTYIGNHISQTGQENQEGHQYG